jgi:hypothetical protein
MAFHEHSTYLPIGVERERVARPSIIGRVPALIIGFILILIFWKDMDAFAEGCEPRLGD